MTIVEVVIIDHSRNIFIIVFQSHPFQRQQKDEGRRQTLLTVHDLDLLEHRRHIRLHRNDDAEKMGRTAILEKILNISHQTCRLRLRPPRIASLIHRDHKLRSHRCLNQIRNICSDRLFYHLSSNSFFQEPIVAQGQRLTFRLPAIHFPASKTAQTGHRRFPRRDTRAIDTLLSAYSSPYPLSVQLRRPWHSR